MKLMDIYGLVFLCVYLLGLLRSDAGVVPLTGSGTSLGAAQCASHKKGASRLRRSTALPLKIEFLLLFLCFSCFSIRQPTSSLAEHVDMRSYIVFIGMVCVRIPSVFFRKQGTYKMEK